ncbi:MAG: hypothetical protein ACK4Z5_11465 [Brevundimonas sp.]
MKPDTQSTRIQVYLSDPRLIEALKRDARLAGQSLSQAAGRAVARGLARTVAADPDDRLAALERALRDHMRSNQRDMQIVQELVVELARAFFLRLPDAAIDEDPMMLASVERRIDRLLDATAARLIRGGTVPRDPDPRSGVAA